jgi:hypothetical protein
MKKTMKRSARNGQKDQGVVKILREVRDILHYQDTRPAPLISDVPKETLSRGRTYKFQSSYDGITITSSNVGIVAASLNFDLASISNSVDIVGLFDQYRILQVRVVFLPRQTAAGGIYGDIYTVLDYDDSVLLTSTSDALQYDNLMTLPAGQYFERVLNPRIAMAAYSGIVFNGFANMEKVWLDAASTIIQHYGLKILVTPGSAAPTPIYDLKITLTVEARAQR